MCVIKLINFLVPGLPGQCGDIGEPGPPGKIVLDQFDNYM